MRRRMRALRLLGVAIRLNYSSEDVDEERERERDRGTTIDSWRKYTPGYKQKRQPSKGDPLHLWTMKAEKPQKGRPWEGSGRNNKERRERYIPYKEPNPRILQNLSKTPREILAFEKVVKTFVKPPKMVSKTRDTSKYCKLHQYYSHDTNACRELKSQIEEAVRSGKLTHLIKGIRMGKAKQVDAQLGEWIAPTVKAKQATEGKE
ncbi:hypothetical protein Tco_1187119 [Tanacetum coccineum]